MAKYRSNLPQMKGGDFLSDGGMETALIFLEGVDLPHFASFPLVETAEGPRMRGNSTWCRPLQNLAGFQAELLEQHRQFVDQRYVDVALNVLDHLGCFAHLDRAHLVCSRLDRLAVDVVDEVRGFGR